MKTPTLLFTLFIYSFCFAQQTKTIDRGTIGIVIPVEWKHYEVKGTDSYRGIFIYQDDTINYDLQSLSLLLLEGGAKRYLRQSGHNIFSSSGRLKKTRLSTSNPKASYFKKKGRNRIWIYFNSNDNEKEIIKELSKTLELIKTEPNSR